jgi:hypothetical protein
MLSIDDINYSLMDPAKAGAVSCIETPVVKYMMIGCLLVIFASAKRT